MTIYRISHNLNKKGHTICSLKTPRIDKIFIKNINGLSFEGILASGRTPEDYERVLRDVLKQTAITE